MASSDPARNPGRHDPRRFATRAARAAPLVCLGRFEEAADAVALVREGARRIELA
jgi:hypothetical protein